MLDCHFSNFSYPTYPIVDVWSSSTYKFSLHHFNKGWKIIFWPSRTVTCEHCIGICAKIDEKREFNLFCEIFTEKNVTCTVKPLKDTSKSTTEKITQHVVSSIGLAIHLKEKFLSIVIVWANTCEKGIWGLHNIRFWLNLKGKKDD